MLVYKRRQHFLANRTNIAIEIGPLPVTCQYLRGYGFFVPVSRCSALRKLAFYSVTWENNVLANDSESGFLHRWPVVEKIQQFWRNRLKIDWFDLKSHCMRRSFWTQRGANLEIPVLPCNIPYHVFSEMQAKSFTRKWSIIILAVPALKFQKNIGQTVITGITA